MISVEIQNIPKKLLLQKIQFKDSKSQIQTLENNYATLKMAFFRGKKIESSHKLGGINSKQTKQQCSTVFRHVLKEVLERRETFQMLFKTLNLSQKQKIVVYIDCLFEPMTL